MTKEYAYKMHYKMWDEIVKEIGKGIQDWNSFRLFKMNYVKKNERYVMFNSCYLCEYHADDCDKCVLGNCKIHDSLIGLLNSKEYEVARLNAIRIRDCVKKELDEIESRRDGKNH